MPSERRRYLSGDVPQHGVVAVLEHELIVCALFDDFAAIHDDDAVGGFDGGQAVGDDDAGAVFHQAFGLLDGRSDSLSNALVASSNNNIGASFKMARAMATRCRCPPDKLLPFDPMGWCSPSGDASIRLCRLAAWRADRTSDSPASGRLYRTFSNRVSSNRNTSWETRANWARRQSSLMSAMSIPSMQMLPARRFDKAGQKVDDGGFAAAGTSDQGDAFALSDVEVEVVEGFDAV